jgi:hypothetical protein
MQECVEGGKGDCHDQQGGFGGDPFVASIGFIVAWLVGHDDVQL